MNATLPSGVQNIRKKLSKKTVIFIALAIVASLGGSAYILFFTGPTPRKAITNLFEKAPTVSLSTGVRNPFNIETQYVNPFDPTKSPFYSLKQTAE